MVGRSILFLVALAPIGFGCRGATDSAGSAPDARAGSLDASSESSAADVGASEAGPGAGDATVDAGDAARDSGNADADANTDANDHAVTGAEASACPDLSGCTLEDGGRGTCCSGRCVSTASDRTECGGCGQVCPTNAECRGGACVRAVCAPDDPSAPCVAPDGGTGVCCRGACKTFDAFQNDNLDCSACGAICRAGLTCSGGGCIPSDADAMADCPAGYEQGNFLACYPVDCTGLPDGLGCLRGGLPYPTGACCGGACQDLASDPAHCGACGHACSAGQYCFGGACRDVSPCAGQKQGALCGLPSGRAGECCAGACVDPFADPSNCGGCGSICPTGTTCLDPSGGAPVTSGSEGSCVLGDAGVASCDPQVSPVTAACPAGTVCEDGYTCAAASCTGAGVEACFLPGEVGALGFIDLGACCAAGDGGCPDLRFDPANCGACGVACPSGACDQGVCVPAPSDAGCAALGGCPTGTVCAAGYCVALASACPADPSTAGAALCSIDGGPSLGVCCGGRAPIGSETVTCADLVNDPSNCGTCFHTCGAGQTCSAGRCQ